jgi:hypothetical protein
MEKKRWIDHRGNEVPAKYVPALEKDKDTYCSKTLRKAIEISAKLKAFKTDLLMEAEHLYYKMLEESNIDVNTRKGNMTIASFDKSIKIEISVQERIEFDDNITLAQEKINEYLRLKLADGDMELAELVNSAFTTSKGKLDNKRILSLFRMKIRHHLWIDAIELIKKSIQVNSTKRYIQIWVKDDQGAYKAVDLSLSTL